MGCRNVYVMSFLGTSGVPPAMVTQCIEIIRKACETNNVKLVNIQKNAGVDWNTRMGSWGETCEKAMQDAHNSNSPTLVLSGCNNATTVERSGISNSLRLLGDSLERIVFVEFKTTRELTNAANSARFSGSNRGNKKSLAVLKQIPDTTNGQVALKELPLEYQNRNTQSVILVNPGSTREVSQSAINQLQTSIGEFAYTPQPGGEMWPVEPAVDWDHDDGHADVPVNWDDSDDEDAGGHSSLINHITTKVMFAVSRLHIEPVQK